MLAVWIRTLFSFRAYHLLACAGKWRLAFFVFYLVMVTVIGFHIYFSWQIHKNLPVFLQDFPEVTFEKGRLTAPNTPQRVALPGTDFSIVLDATAAQPPSRQEFIEKGMAAFVREDKIYTLAAAGLNSQTLPPTLNVQITPNFLADHRNEISSALQSLAFFGSCILVTVYFIFSYIFAFAVLTLWRGISRKALPFSVLLRLAVLLLGPAAVLCLVNLFIGIPLFLFAQFILFTIYAQQIFNTCEVTHVA